MRDWPRLADTTELIDATVMSVNHKTDFVNTYGISGIPSRLRYLRGARSQTEFSELCGINQSAYSNYERGIREIPLSAASRIAEALSVDLAWLLIGVPSGAMPPSGHELRLSEMLAWLAGEWEAHNDHGRARLRRRFQTAFPEWRKPFGED